VIPFENTTTHNGGLKHSIAKSKLIYPNASRNPMLQPLQWGNPAKKPKIQKEKKMLQWMSSKYFCQLANGF